MSSPHPFSLIPFHSLLFAVTPCRQSVAAIVGTSGTMRSKYRDRDPPPAVSSAARCVTNGQLLERAGGAGRGAVTWGVGRVGDPRLPSGDTVRHMAPFQSPE